MAVFHCPAQLITVASICNQCVAGACLNVLYPTVSQRRGLAHGAGRVKVRTDPRILPGNREDAHVHGNAPTLTGGWGCAPCETLPRYQQFVIASIKERLYSELAVTSLWYVEHADLTYGYWDVNRFVAISIPTGKCCSLLSQLPQLVCLGIMYGCCACISDPCSNMPHASTWHFPMLASSIVE